LIDTPEQPTRACGCRVTDRVQVHHVRHLKDLHKHRGKPGSGLGSEDGRAPTKDPGRLPRLPRRHPHGSAQSGRSFTKRDLLLPTHQRGCWDRQAGDAPRLTSQRRELRRQSRVAELEDLLGFGQVLEPLLAKVQEFQAVRQPPTARSTPNRACGGRPHAYHLATSCARSAGTRPCGQLERQAIPDTLRVDHDPSIHQRDGMTKPGTEPIATNCWVP
jgi:hypothetical protein